MLEEIPSSCETCLRYKKVQPRSVVGFSLASRFNEWVALGMKDIKGNKILHLIDAFSKYSVAVRVPNKESSTIINTIFKYWVADFGCPSNVLTDNGHEFDNQYFRDERQNLNIIVRMTGAESPWSNGVCERYNGVIEECVIKTLEDTKCLFDVAVAWTVSAKNTLNTVHWFSLNQLLFGKNPSLQSVALNKPPALEGVTACDIVAENLNAMHAAHKAYIASESSGKLRRALRHQVRPAISARYNIGDLVYFKRNDLDQWLGPGTVIGTEHKQVLIKHGGSYVRVHPCRLIPYSKTIPTTNPQEFNVETSDNGQKNMSNVDQIPSTDLRGHFDDSKLPNEDVTVDSEALSQPESN